MARRPKNVNPPFKVGDAVKTRSIGGTYAQVYRNYTPTNQPVLIIVRKVSYVGKQHCETGWLIDAWDARKFYVLRGYDASWFRKV